MPMIKRLCQDLFALQAEEKHQCRKQRHQRNRLQR